MKDDEVAFTRERFPGGIITWGTRLSANFLPPARPILIGYDLAGTAPWFAPERDAADFQKAVTDGFDQIRGMEIDGIWMDDLEDK